MGRDAAVAAVARVRVGRAPDATEAGLPRTFRLPADELAWRAAAAAVPDTSWVRRPVATVPDVRDVPVRVEDHLDRDPRWVIQESVPALTVDGTLCVVRRRGLVLSWDPLLVASPESGQEPAPATWGVDDAGLRRAMRRLLDDLVAGSRETLLRAARAQVGADGPAAALAVEVVATLDRLGRPWLLEVVTAPPGPDVPTSGRPPASTPLLPRPAEPGPAAAPAPADGVGTWTLAEEAVVRAPDGAVHVLDGMAVYVWEACLAGVPAATTIAELREEAGDAVDVAVWNQLGTWVEAGLLTTGDRAVDAPTPVAAVRPVPLLTWNAQRVYGGAGRSVVVRAPTTALAEWVDRGLHGLAVPDGPIWAFVDVERRPTGWWVVGTHHPALPCGSAYQLPLLVRWSVLTGLVRTAEPALVEATVLTAGRGAVVVLGPVGHRIGVALAWIAAGGRVLCNGLSPATDRIGPLRSGIQAHEADQWFEGDPPPWGAPRAPLVDRDGWIARVWFAPPTAMSGEELPVTSVVVLDDGSAAGPVSAGGVVRALLDARPEPAIPLEETQVDRLVDLARRPAVRLPATPAAGVVEWMLAHGGA